jgi:hypothetical protein
MDLRRPKPETFVQYDPNNYYAQLGLSPLDSTRKIKAEITRRQMEAKKRSLSKQSQEFGADEEEFDRLQKITEVFGSNKKREKYDLLNPQSELLTVQPSPDDRWFDPQYRIDLVSAWLLEELGQQLFLPAAESLSLWAPKAIEPELIEILARCMEEKPDEISMAEKVEKPLEGIISEEEQSLLPEELQTIIESYRDGNNKK